MTENERKETRWANQSVKSLQEALFPIIEAIADTDGDETVGSINVDIPHGGYPRQWIREAARRALNRDPVTNKDLTYAPELPKTRKRDPGCAACGGNSEWGTCSVCMADENAAAITNAADLRPWGYAPGGYIFRCIDCPDTFTSYERMARMGDKYSSRCREHAIAARDAAMRNHRMAHTTQADANEGYVTAFYEIAKMLGIGAQALSPAYVWRTQMRPKMEALNAYSHTRSEDVERMFSDVAIREGIRKAKIAADKKHGIAWHHLEEISRVELILDALRPT